MIVVLELIMSYIFTVSYQYHYYLALFESFRSSQSRTASSIITMRVRSEFKACSFSLRCVSSENSAVTRFNRKLKTALYDIVHFYI